VRARVFHRETHGGFRFAGELDAEDADDVWRMAESSMVPGSALKEGDVVYIGDLYFELDGDGGWHPIQPGELTRRLYRVSTEPSA
jgi:hypothetical protein